jgi:predicted MPP superfamily phosphohydrolase
MRVNFVIFLGIVLTVYFLMHLYLYTQIAWGLKLSPRARHILAITFGVAAPIFLMVEILCGHIDAWGVQTLYFLGATWVGTVAIALSVFIVTHLLRLVIRQETFRPALTLGAIVVTLLLAAYSVFHAACGPELTIVRIQSPKISQAHSGFTVVQLSDIHLDFCKSEKWLERIVEEVNRQQPDLIVITGDWIDTDLSRTQKFYHQMRSLRARFGIYAIAGNHEIYTGLDAFRRIAAECRIQILQNEQTSIANFIRLAGIDYNTGMRIERTANGVLPSSILFRQDGQYNILLSHLPDVFLKSAPQGADLQLSGHTHKGQIPPMTPIVMLKYCYPYGLYQIGKSSLYTTSGTDGWGPPMRLFSTAEIVKIVLEAQKP